MKKIFVCSPYRGEVDNNAKKAKEYAYFVYENRCLPIVPHLFFTQILDENNHQERMDGILFGIELLKECDEIWVFGCRITQGMEYELKQAEKLYIPVCCFDEKCNQIKPETMSLDDRLDEKYIKTLYGMKLI